MFNFGDKSRYEVYNSEKLIHRSRPYNCLVSSKSYENFIKTTLPSLTYKTAIVPVGLEGRPDLLSFASYGTVSYWWLICEANNIVDPSEDIYAGRQIKIPVL